jgi:methylenetetrahydrofolate reductase (NADPH)
VFFLPQELQLSSFSSIPLISARDTELLQAMRELYGTQKPSVSFEFFPPKCETSEDALWKAITALAPLNPWFVSVTYGAGGSTRERTHATVTRIKRETRLSPAAHLTCIGHSKAEIDDIADIYWEAGVRNLVALRGDMPKDASALQKSDYQYADQLVEALKKRHDFDISVAAYPEKHPEARSLDDDIDHLKRKLDAGATQAITQYFFDVDVYLRFVDRCRARGIHNEIIPGILPVTNVAQLKRFSAMCGTTVPDWLAKLFDGLDEKPELRHSIAAMVAAEQVRMLMLAGVTNYHFYTLNRAELTLAMCHILGVRPTA